MGSLTQVQILSSIASRRFVKMSTSFVRRHDKSKRMNYLSATETSSSTQVCCDSVFSIGCTEIMTFYEGAVAKNSVSHCVTRCRIYAYQILIFYFSKIAILLW